MMVLNPRHAIKLVLTVLLMLTCSSCAGIPSPEERRQNASRLLADNDWIRIDLQTSPFVLTAFLPKGLSGGQAAGACLTVYIEGDGLAWSSYTRPSADPTPDTPMALLLAIAQQDGPAVALARPCQYITLSSDHRCRNSQYWTSHRFAPEVIGATDQALSRLKDLTGATCLRLVGYSGGGAVAALVAVKRDDIRELVTVAGNLDHVTWTTHHRLDPLNGSLNPLDAASDLVRLPQRHFVGSDDTVIPKAIAERFLARQGKPDCASLYLIPGLDHGHGWPQRWPELWRLPLPCTPPEYPSSRFYPAN